MDMRQWQISWAFFHEGYSPLTVLPNSLSFFIGHFTTGFLHLLEAGTIGGKGKNKIEQLLQIIHSLSEFQV